MTTLALSLVLLSAVFHATWNLFAKRTGGGTAFIWLVDLLAVILFLPPVIFVIVTEKPQIGLVEIGLMLGSAVLQLAYFVTLLRGYRTGDLSLVYPLARGTGPLISTLGAIILLGERPSVPAIIGAILIAGGALFLTGGPKMLQNKHAGEAALFGLITGLLIGAYTIWDKEAVSAFAIPPILQYYGTTVAGSIFLLPFLRGRSVEVKTVWREHRKAILIVGILSPISYVLVLTALTLSPVSYVAPTREISILLGTWLGTRILSEGDAKRKLAASGAMMLGVIALAFG